MRHGDHELLGNVYQRGLLAWVGWVVRRPGITLALSLVCVAAASLYSGSRMRMNSDTSQLIRQDAPFRQHYSHYLDAFPQFKDTTLVVLSGDSIDQVEDAQRRLASALSTRPDVIASLHAPGADPFFEDHALLYLELDELERVINRLAEAQPALAALSEDASLRGLFGELQSGIEALAEGETVPAGFAMMADRVTEIAESIRSGHPRAVSWTDELLEHSGTVYRLIIVQGVQDFDLAVPARHLIHEIRTAATELGIEPDAGVTVRLTGMVPLAHEELVSLREGLFISSAVALTLLIAILGFGLRSLRIIVATVSALVASLVLTSAWAMATVGEFNTVSAAFAVLLIGLGVDFGVHIGLRYEEETRRGVPVSDALLAAAAATGTPVSLCALTSAIGFAAFIPTEYRGLAALGVIAAGGMFISLIVSYTILPAVLSLFGPPTPRAQGRGASSSHLFSLIERRAGLIVASAGVLAAVTVGVSYTQISFDFSTLGLKDPRSESMLTLHELHREDIVTDYSVTALSPNLASADALAERLAALDLVLEVRPPSHHVPSDQETKLEMLEEAAFFLEPILNPGPPRRPPNDTERLEATAQLLDALAALPEDVQPDARDAGLRLADALSALLRGDDRAAQAKQLEELVVADLAEQIEWLGRALRVGPVGFEDLPLGLRERLVSKDGSARIVALPVEDVSDTNALRRFVDAIESVSPGATGRPVVEAGIGGIVVRSFRLAIGIALVSILVVLLLTLRRLGDSLLVLAPITLVAFFTVAVGIATDNYFNMANVVAIPLILGLGVDSGIHMLMRFRHDVSLESAIESSTPRAVTLSALTTLAAFGSLALSPHRGLGSLGFLLSVSVVGLLYATLVVLPALLLLRDRWRQHAR